ncbi:MAG: polysaccharide deacetylase family protein [Arcicella sp.]|nr:polysaccharide deacetylase family protein [Arcicella sp.]
MARQAGIALSFDDRFVKEWNQLRPLLKKYNVKATFYITQPDSLSDKEVKMLHEMAKEGHEIGCHGAIHARSIPYIWEYSLNKYMENEIFHCLKTMKKQGFSPTTFAHPGGSQMWYSDRELLKYFTLLRDVSMKTRNIWEYEYTRKIEDMDEIYHQHDNTQKVNALLIDVGTKLTVEDIQKGLQRTKHEGSVMMIFGHKPLDGNTQKPDEYGFDIHFLEQILAESAKLELKFYRMDELCGKRVKGKR